MSCSKLSYIENKTRKMGSTTRVYFINIYLEGCRGAALKHSGVHLHRQGWKWSQGSVLLRSPPLHPNPPSGQTPAFIVRSSQEVTARVSTVHTHIHSYTHPKCCLLIKKQNFSSLAPFSSLTAPSQKRMENVAATGTLQENKLRGFPKAKHLWDEKSSSPAAP